MTMLADSKPLPAELQPAKWRDRERKTPDITYFAVKWRAWSRSLGDWIEGIETFESEAAMLRQIEACSVSVVKRVMSFNAHQNKASDVTQQVAERIVDDLRRKRSYIDPELALFLQEELGATALDGLQIEEE